MYRAHWQIEKLLEMRGYYFVCGLPLAELNPEGSPVLLANFPLFCGAADARSVSRALSNIAKIGIVTLPRLRRITVSFGSVGRLYMTAELLRKLRAPALTDFVLDMNAVEEEQLSLAYDNQPLDLRADNCAGSTAAHQQEAGTPRSSAKDQDPEIARRQRTGKIPPRTWYYGSVEPDSRRPGGGGSLRSDAVSDFFERNRHYFMCSVRAIRAAHDRPFR
eukprot:Polyplicarium_translucidae@DN2602_c0_g1_i5.p1